MNERTLHQGPSVVFNVLVVDDDRISAQAVEETLQASPLFAVKATAESPAEALEVAARVPLDVIVLDEVFPSGSGTDAIADFKRLAPYAQIVMYSTTPATHALAEGAAAVVRKPNLPELVATITDVIGATIDLRAVIREATTHIDLDAPPST